MIAMLVQRSDAFLSTSLKVFMRHSHFLGNLLSFPCSGCYLLTLLFFTSSIAKNQADFLIIENPGVYTILNEYQQPLSEDEKKHLYPFTPFQIISPAELLGDQITYVSKFSYNGKTHFIPVNSKSQRVPKAATWEKVYRNCIVYNDTVIASRSIKVFIKQPGSAEAFRITSGSAIRRIFNYQSLWYVASVGRDDQFGWYQGSTDIFIKKKKQTVGRDTISTTDVAEKVHTRLLAANEDYKTFFEYFNKKTQQQKSVPFWTMVIDGPVIRCILNGSSVTTQHLESSTTYITSDIEHLLLGKPFFAYYQHGEIIISPRTTN